MKCSPFLVTRIGIPKREIKVLFFGVVGRNPLSN